jgi:YggT family protein
MIEVIASIYLFVRYLIIFVITFTIVLMLVRLIMNSMDVNPFTWHAMTVRRLSDPFLNPVKRSLVNTSVPLKYSPIIAILLVLLVGWFSLELIEGLLNTIGGVLLAAKAGALVAVLGYVLYGLLALYGLMIFLRIIFSWGMVGYRNRMMRFLINTTDPLLLPLRKMVPRVGMFDISPIVAFIIVWILQAAVQGTLLRGWPLRFFG